MLLDRKELSARSQILPRKVSEEHTWHLCGFHIAVLYKIAAQPTKAGQNKAGQTKRIRPSRYAKFVSFLYQQKPNNRTPSFLAKTAKCTIIRHWTKNAKCTIIRL